MSIHIIVQSYGTAGSKIPCIQVLFQLIFAAISIISTTTIA